MIGLPFKRFPFLLATALILSLPCVVAASPESHRLIVQGAADLEAQNYAEALKKFAAAARSDPKDSEAVYFQGAALNRLGRPQEALQQLEQAAKMGFRGVGLTFDTGWALLRLGHWQDAISQLKYFEIVVSGRAKTSEFLGRAYLGLGDYDQAEAKLEEAMQRDQDVAPTALLYLTALEQERKNPVSARQYLETLLREAPDSPIARALMQKLKEQPRPPEKGGLK
jgi:tetratricopeptide (TPR) repeat protein